MKTSRITRRSSLTTWLCWLPWLIALAGQAQTTEVLFSTVNLTGTVNNQTITITPDATQDTPVWVGTNFVDPTPFDIYPVNGTNIQFLVPWGYTLTMAGWPRGLHIQVPASTNLLSAAALVNTNRFSPLNLYLNALYPGANITLVTNSDGSVTISSSGGGGAGANLGAGNGITLSTNAGQTVVTALTNGFVTATITNGLATTNYVNTSTNGFVTAAITNSFLTTNGNGSGLTGIIATSTNFTLANPTNAGALATNQFAFLSGNQWGGAAPMPPICYNTWNSYYQYYSSNNFTNDLSWLRTTAPVLLSYSPQGFVLSIDDGLFSSRNAAGVLQINPTNFPWTASQLTYIAHTNGVKILCYMEPNSPDRNGLTSAGFPDSEGTNIEFDAAQFATMGFDGLKIDPHGWGNDPAKVVQAAQRAEAAFRYAKTNQSAVFLHDAGFRYLERGYASLNPNVSLYGHALPGTIIRIGQEFGDGGNTNSGWTAYLTNYFDQMIQLQALNYSGQWVVPVETPVDDTTGSQDTPVVQRLIQLSSAVFGGPPLYDEAANVSAASLAMMTNTEILDIALDPGWAIGQPAAFTGGSNTFQVVVKPLTDRDDGKALFFLSRSTNNSQTATIGWTNAGFAFGRQILVRDVVSRTNFGVYSNSFSLNLGPEQTYLLRLEPIDNPYVQYLLSTVSANSGLPITAAQWGIQTNSDGSINFTNAASGIAFSEDYNNGAYFNIFGSTPSLFLSDSAGNQANINVRSVAYQQSRVGDLRVDSASGGLNWHSYDAVGGTNLEMRFDKNGFDIFATNFPVSAALGVNGAAYIAAALTVGNGSVIAGNGIGITNQPVIQTATISGGTLAFTKNPNGTTNMAITVTGGGGGGTLPVSGAGWFLQTNSDNSFSMTNTTYSDGFSMLNNSGLYGYFTGVNPQFAFLGSSGGQFTIGVRTSAYQLDLPGDARLDANVGRINFHGYNSALSSNYDAWFDPNSLGFGIGTTNITHTLEVAGSGNFGGVLTASAGAMFTTPLLITNGNTTSLIEFPQNHAGAGATNQIQSAISGGFSFLDFAGNVQSITASNASLANITASGTLNVGGVINGFLGSITNQGTLYGGNYSQYTTTTTNTVASGGKIEFVSGSTLQVDSGATVTGISGGSGNPGVSTGSTNYATGGYGLTNVNNASSTTWSNLVQSASGSVGYWFNTNGALYFGTNGVPVMSFTPTTSYWNILNGSGIVDGSVTITPSYVLAPNFYGSLVLGSSANQGRIVAQNTTNMSISTGNGNGVAVFNGFGWITPSNNFNLYQSTNGAANFSTIWNCPTNGGYVNIYMSNGVPMFWQFAGHIP